MRSSGDPIRPCGEKGDPVAIPHSLDSGYHPTKIVPYNNCWIVGVMER